MSDTFCSVPQLLRMRSLFGLERENLRILTDGTLALTPHPDALGDKLTHPAITTDFSESQLELITSAVHTIPALVDQLNALLQHVYPGLGHELLWPLSSLPDGVPDEDKIPIADFGAAGEDKNAYRRYLAAKYGSRKQLYCGVHLNFSFDAGDLAVTLPDQNGRDAFYLNLSANAMAHRYFLIYLLAASPEETSGISYRSIRLGKEGYRNLAPIYPDYSSAACFLSSIKAAVADGKIEGSRELYQHIRLKGAGFDDLQQAPHIARLELRIPDLNPLYSLGVNPDDLRLIHLYLLWSASYKDSAPFDRAAQQTANQLADQAALMYPGAAFREKMNTIFNLLERFVNANALPLSYHAALEAASERWRNPEKGYAEQIAAQIRVKGKSAAGLAWARAAKQRFVCPSGRIG